jgi:hypothetical protein
MSRVHSRRRCGTMAYKGRRAPPFYPWSVRNGQIRSGTIGIWNWFWRSIEKIRRIGGPEMVDRNYRDKWFRTTAKRFDIMIALFFNFDRMAFRQPSHRDFLGLIRKRPNNTWFTWLPRYMGPCMRCSCSTGTDKSIEYTKECGEYALFK